MLQHYNSFLRNFWKISYVFWEKFWWDDMKWNKAKIFAERKNLGILKTAREKDEGISPLGTREEGEKIRTVWDIFLFFHLRWKWGPDAEIMIRNAWKNLWLYYSPNRKRSEKSAHTMEPDSIGIIFENSSAKFSSKNDIVVWSDETGISEEFCPFSFLDIPSEYFHFVPVFFEEVCYIMHVSFYTTENRRVVRYEEYFFRLGR